MKLDFIDMGNLSIAAANMRGKGKDPDVADLLPSIRARGVLVPLLVRPNCAEGRFEIVAGRRRFTAVGAVAREGGAVRPIPCAILDEGDDADALEASMLENLARVQPDEVSQWEAFVALVKAGRSVEGVADNFGFEPRAVKRILALGNLLPRIRTLYRGGEIDAGTVRHLTLASKSQQKAWLALFDDESAYCPTGHQLKAWLFGGTAIAVKHALFDVADAKAAIVSDLFGEDSFFADGDAFWLAQMAAIDARKATYLEAGWSDVVVMARGDWFRSWDHAHAGKRKGGRIYVEVRESGEVTFHGPGQVVIYLLMDLRRNKPGGKLYARQFVAKIEQAVIEVLAAYNLAGERVAGAPGIYIAQGPRKGAKIAALGLKVRGNGCTYHGVSLNVAMDLAPFTWINPCGYSGLATVDMRTMGVEAPLADVQQALAQELVRQLVTIEAVAPETEQTL